MTASSTPLPGAIASKQSSNSSFEVADADATALDDDVLTPSASSPLASSPAPVAALSGVISAAIPGVGGDPPQRVATSGSGLVFLNTFTPNDTAAYESDVVAAEKQLEGLFTNSVTLSVKFDMANTVPGDTDGNRTTGGQDTYSYATLKAAILKFAPDDVFPATDPSGGKGFTIPEAYARMLGLPTTQGAPAIDASVTFNSTGETWDFGQDVVNAITHGISEAGMGRDSGLGVVNGDIWTPMDLFRYNSAGVYDPSPSDGPIFFSSDGGKQTSASAGLSFNSGDSDDSDPDDWQQQAVFGGNDAGETLTLTPTDLDMMSALGWTVNLKQQVFSASSGNWESPTNWANGYNPISAEDVAIGDAGAATATLSDNVTVNSISLEAASSLLINNRATLTLTNGTTLDTADTSVAYSGDKGTITVDDASTLSVGGVFDNAGSLIVEDASVLQSGFVFENAISSALTIEGYRSGAKLGDSLENSGSLGVGVGAYAQVGGAVENTGTITLGEQIDESPVTGDSGELALLAGTTILQGRGAIEMGQITVGFSADALRAPGSGPGSGPPVFYESSGVITDTNGLGSLINFDNTISGAGIISVGSLDNQSGGSIDASFAGYSLQIESVAIHNEGDLSAQAQTTLELGELPSSGAVSLANAGQIELAAGAELAIASNLSASGAGFINFNGAGAAIASEGAGPVTFTNANTILATASSQIGDVGVKPANDLTLIDTGSILAKGSGVTLTLDTGANTIFDDGGLFEAEAGAQLTIDSAVQTGKFAPIGIGRPTPTAPSTIEAASGGIVDINASIHDAAPFSNLFAGQILIDGGTVNVAAGVLLGVPVSFGAAGGTLNLADTPNTVDVSGADGAIALFDAQANVSGAGFSITETGVDTLTVGGNGAGGAADVVHASGATTTVLDDSLVSFAGANDTIDAGAGDELALQGANDVLNLQQLFGETIVRDFGASDVMQISASDFANFQALLGHATQSGGNTLITLDAHDAIELTGVAVSSLTASQFKFV